MPLQSTSKHNLLDRASPLLRFLGHDQPARAVVDSALLARSLPIQQRSWDTPETQPGNNGFANTYDIHTDSVLIDTSLDIVEPEGSVPEPPLGVGYAGLNPQQRYRFLEWTADPTKPAPTAFRQLYVASLEVRLLEDDAMLLSAHKELVKLGLQNSWTGSGELASAVLLGFWLRQDGVGLARWTQIGAVPAELVGVALGFQTLLGQTLHVKLLIRIIKQWSLHASTLTQDVLRMRLGSLNRSLGSEPLTHALEQLPEEQRRFAPWRCTHRDIRIAVPQPDLRTTLEPLLVDMLSLVDIPISDDEGQAIPLSTNAHESHGSTNQGNESQDVAVDDAPALEAQGWQLILQFGQSRSEFFQYVLDQCQRLSGFTQLMDEDRQMVYRVAFKKNEMRRFWRIWDYVQNWSSTTVYLNGEELEKWKIWPYSQYLR